MGLNELPSQVVITEVGPRDGLQSYPAFISTQKKIQILENLLDAGLKHIQITSFVNPQKVPQFKDAEDIVGVFRDSDLVLTVLVLNKKGLDRAISAGARGVELSISASDEFSVKNTGMSKKDSIKNLQDMLKKSEENRMYIRGSVQCCFGYLNENDVSVDDILEIVDVFLNYEVNEIVFADTTALANPISINNFFNKILKKIDPDIISMHYHSKMNLGIVNIYESLQFGIKRFDTSFGYIGGCPFVNNRYINVSTEEVVYLLDSFNIYTGIDITKLKKCSDLLKRCSS